MAARTSRDAPVPGPSTPEEQALLASIDSARSRKDWDAAFRDLQRLLAGVRSRKDEEAVHAVLALFARVLRESGDPAAADRARSYAEGRFR